MKYGHKCVLGLHVKYPLFLSDFNETRTFSTDFTKNSNKKFHENPSSCSLRTDRLTDTMKLIVVFSSLAETLKNYDVDNLPPPRKKRIRKTETKLKGLWS